MSVWAENRGGGRGVSLWARDGGEGHVQGTVLGVKESVHTWKPVCESVCVCLDVCEYTWNGSRDRGEGSLPKIQSLLDLP